MEEKRKRGRVREDLEREEGERINGGGESER